MYCAKCKRDVYGKGVHCPKCGNAVLTKDTSFFSEVGNTVSSIGVDIVETIAEAAADILDVFDND